MTAITIYIKLLVGDIVSLEVAPRLSTTDLYIAAFHALPEEIRPEAMYALQLLRSVHPHQDQHQDQGHVLPFTDEMLEMEQGEHLCALISPSQFTIRLVLIGQAVDIEEEEFFYEYERYSLAVYYNSRLVSQKQFYVTPFRYQEDHEDENEGVKYLRLIGPYAEISPYFQEEEGEFYRGTTDHDIRPLETIRDLVHDMIVARSAIDDLYAALDDAWEEEYGRRIEEGFLGEDLALHLEQEEQEQEEQEPDLEEDPADWLDNDVIGFE